ncbi:potassium transporter [Penicillium lividum]|nr:potassium transporter [Penicillium lividum]
MTTIRIADDARKGSESRLNGEGAISRTTSNPQPGINEDDDNIYNIRSQARLPVRMSRTPTGQEQADENPSLRLPGDFKEKQNFKGRILLWLAYQSIGVIYGDIGTSPLYVFSSTFSSEPSRQDLVGVLSIIIWSLFMMVTVKYVLVILHADNDGEGGTFSTYALLSRYASDPTPFVLSKAHSQLTTAVDEHNSP